MKGLKLTLTWVAALAAVGCVGQSGSEAVPPRLPMGPLRPGDPGAPPRPHCPCGGYSDALLVRAGSGATTFGAVQFLLAGTRSAAALRLVVLMHELGRPSRT